MKRSLKFLALILSLTFLISGCSLDESVSSPISSSVTSEVSSEAATPTPKPAESPTPEPTATPTPTPTPTPSPTPAPTPFAVDIAGIPAYSGNAYTEVNGNVPYFTESDYTTTSFESYSDLDSMGRCVLAYACVGEDLMPTEKRGEIGQVKPSGWQTVRYDGLVDGNYLYNRCHLIGYQLSGENANEQNLITGTRYLNIEGMLPFENMVADYVKETKNHVMYRVTPIFDGDNLLANGVLMDGRSVEDKGAGISFCVYAYNVQPGVTINYANGESEISTTPEPEPTPTPAIEQPAVVGRPVSRYLDDSWTLEVNRLCTDGPRNACSMLYAAAWRAARAMGYKRLITYILESETGASLRAAGWKCIGQAGGLRWTGKRRPTVDLYPAQMKVRYQQEVEV